MINLLFDELSLIAQIRNISNYENKSKENLINALSEPTPETKPRPKTKPKSETKPKPTPETKSKSQKKVKS